jgi:uncharacterized RDD family membrane protein YckC
MTGGGQYPGQGGYEGGWQPAPGYQYQYGAGSPYPPYASWWEPPLASPLRRIAGRLVDGIIVAVVLLILVFVAGFLSAVASGAQGASSSSGSSADGGFALIAGLLVGTLVVFLYFILPIAKSGQTLGMRLCDMRICHAETLQPIGLGKSTVRFITDLICSSLTILMVANIVMLFLDRRHQCIQDKLANTIVIRDSAGSMAPTPSGPPQPWAAQYPPGYAHPQGYPPSSPGVPPPG